MTSPLDGLHTLLGDDAFNRVEDAFADSPAEGVWQLTWEWAVLPGWSPLAPREAVKVEVRSNLLSGWQPGRSGSLQDPWVYLSAAWFKEGVAYVSSRGRPYLPLEYYDDELVDLAGAFAAWPG